MLGLSWEEMHREIWSAMQVFLMYYEWSGVESENGGIDVVDVVDVEFD